MGLNTREADNLLREANELVMLLKRNLGMGERMQCIELRRVEGQTDEEYFGLLIAYLRICMNDVSLSVQHLLFDLQATTRERDDTEDKLIDALDDDFEDDIDIEEWPEDADRNDFDENF